jgi:hypothetical protein
MTETSAGDIKDRESLEAWLILCEPSNQTAFGTFLAYRTAMRTLPLLNFSEFKLTMWKQRTLLQAFRLCLALRVETRHSGLLQTINGRDAKRKLEKYNMLSGEDDKFNAFRAFAAVSMATREDKVISAVGKAISLAADLKFESTFIPSYSTSLWEAVEEDAQRLQNGEHPSTAAITPLWRPGDSEWWRSEYAEFRSMFEYQVMRKDSWWVWSDWFNTTSEGFVAFNLPFGRSSEIERRIAIGDSRPDFWEREPSAINAEISNWIEEARFQVSDDKLDDQNWSKKVPWRPPLQNGPVDFNPALLSEIMVVQPKPLIVDEELQPPSRVAQKFARSIDGQIVLDSNSLSPAGGRQRDEMQELYEEACESAAALMSLGSNKLGSCFGPAKFLQDHMPNKFTDASIHRLWSKANVLRDLLRQHEDEIAKLIQYREIGLVLESETAVKLNTCVRQLNVLIAFDEKGRELDRLSSGPEFRKRDTAQIAAATSIVQNIYHVADQATVNVIQGDHNSVQHAGANIHGDQALENVVAQESNLVMFVLWSCRKMIAAFGDVPIPVEMAVQIVTSVGGKFGPEILKFVAEHQSDFENVLHYIENAKALIEFVKQIAELWAKLG